MEEFFRETQGMDGEKKEKGAPGQPPGSAFLMRMLSSGLEQRHHHRKEGYTLDQGCGDDHVGADHAFSFGLAGNGFYSAAADATDAQSGTNGCQTTSNGTDAIDGVEHENG
jgi:hypothetical protein